MQTKSVVQSSVARPKADTIQITFRIPTHWNDQADALAMGIAEKRGITASRTDVFREALARGFDALENDLNAEIFRVSAWDGKATRCLFWITRDPNEAIAKADELAKAHAGAAEIKWTVFRVYRGEDDHPIHTAQTAKSSSKKR